MKSYKLDKNKLKIEANNCIIIVTEGLSDVKGRNVTSISVKPDRFAGENKNVLRGLSNTRVVTLKKKNI